MIFIRPILAAILLFPYSLHAQTKGASMPVVAQDQATAIHRFYEECLNQHRSEVLSEIFTPDAVFHAPNGDATGVAAIQQTVDRVHAMFPDHHFVVEDIVVHGDKGAALLVDDRDQHRSTRWHSAYWPRNHSARHRLLSLPGKQDRRVLGAARSGWSPSSDRSPDSRWTACGLPPVAITKTSRFRQRRSDYATHSFWEPRAASAVCSSLLRSNKVMRSSPSPAPRKRSPCAVLNYA